MKANWKLLAVGFVLAAVQAASADWMYVETTGAVLNSNKGSGYLKDLNSGWILPAVRTKNTFELTVNRANVTADNFKEAENPAPWDFSTIKTTTVTGQPESDCKVIVLQGWEGVNITELIAPHCKKIQNANAFKDCKKLKKVYLPESTIFGDSTFMGCDLLESVYIPALEQMQTSTSDAMFQDCTGLKSFEWNMPMKIVPPSFFNGCSSLARVDFKTAVTTVSGSAFKNISPGAELYMPAEAPETIDAFAFANEGQDKTQRIYLLDNYEAWFEAFKQNHHVIMLRNAEERAAFNAGWQEEYSAGKYRTRKTHVIPQMSRDPDVCTVLEGSDQIVKFNKRGLLAFAMRKHTGTNPCQGCWIFKVPQNGFKVIVR